MTEGVNNNNSNKNSPSVIEGMSVTINNAILVVLKIITPWQRYHQYAGSMELIVIITIIIVKSTKNILVTNNQS